MIEDLPLIAFNVRIYKFWSFLLCHTWRRYFCILLCFLCNFCQVLYMFISDDPMEPKLRNAYGIVLWFNTIFRAVLLCLRRYAFESFMENLESLYYEIKDHAEDPVVKAMLDETTNFAKSFSKANLILGITTICGFSSFPLFLEGRVLPYGIYFPLQTETPYYEIIYIYMVFISPFGLTMYIPLTNLIIGFLKFGILMCKFLQYKLRILNERSNSQELLMSKMVWCIAYQIKIINFCDGMNSLTSYLLLVEFVMYGSMLCALLFMFIIASEIHEFALVILYISMIFSQMASLAWYANEFYYQSLEVGQAAYETMWYNCKEPIKKATALLIMRSQKPLTMRIGDIYVMNLETFQSLLNSTYKTFTLLRRFYD